MISRAALCPATLLAVACWHPASAQTPAAPVAQIREAIEGGRLLQARVMLNNATTAQRDDPELKMLRADLALADREDEQALALYRPLAGTGEAGARAAEGAGIAALRLDRNAEAEPLLRAALAQSPGLWRAWNALGVAMDRARRWTEATKAYARALALRPGEAAILANSGYSLFLQHRLDEAALLLNRAAAAAPDDPIIRADRDMVDVLRGRFPEEKPKGESMAAWARRLNNAGYAAFAAGDRATAKALITRAMFASETYYRRAANNLDLIEHSQP
jgi:Flp pilus assembly protein TadD